MLYFDEGQYEQTEWKELYDPDIACLFGYDALPPQIWRFNELAKRDVMEACGVIDKYDDENSKIAAFASLNF